MTTTTRQFNRIHCRSEQQIRGSKLGGYAAVFNEVAEYTPFGREQLATGSLDRALKTSDARALFNHDPMQILGRQSSGTLRLRVDSTGLEYEVDLPDTQTARDLRVLVERGDIDGASFAFVPDLYTQDRDTGITTHTNIRSLIDVSPVTFPAYTGASTEARAAQLTASRRRSQLIRARARVHLGG